jgi:hypothetical protein
MRMILEKDLIMCVMQRKEALRLFGKLTAALFAMQLFQWLRMPL